MLSIAVKIAVVQKGVNREQASGISYLLLRAFRVFKDFNFLDRSCVGVKIAAHLKKDSTL
jgi:hypothetical protein